ncbi:hypothetical protein Tco_0352053 [Tanacetum coccineum]
MESLHPELPGPEEPIMEFSEGKVGVYTKFFEFKNFRIPISQFLFDILGHYQIYLSQLSVIGAAKVDERIFPTVVEWRTNALKDGMPSADSYSMADITTLNTHHTPIQKQPEALLCLVGLSRSYFLGDDVYPTFLYDDDRDMDLLNLINAPNSTKVKTGTRPRTSHEVPLLTATASRVIDMEDTTAASGSSGTPSALEKSPLDFANENPPLLITERDGTEDQVQDGLSRKILPVENPTTTEVVLEPYMKKEVAAIGPLSTLGRKSLASMGLEAGTTFFTPATQETPADAKSVSDPDPMSYAKPQPHPEQDAAQKTATEIPIGNVATTEMQGQIFAESPESGKSASFPSVDGSPGGIYQPEWGVTNNCRLDTSDACQDMVAMGSQLRLRFKQEVKLLKKATAKIARQDQRIQAREKEIKKLDQEIKSLRAVEADVHDLHNQTNNLEALLEDELSQQVSNLQAQVTGEEKIKYAFEEFKKYKDDKVEQRCAEMDACPDKLSVDFDEELYPHMLTAIAGRRWVIGHGMRLAVIKCSESPEPRQAFADVVSAGLVKGMSEGLKHGIEHGKADRDLAVVEAYDPEADSKYIKALQDLKDLKYPLVD